MPAPWQQHHYLSQHLHVYPAQHQYPMPHQNPEVTHQHQKPVQGVHLSQKQCKAITGISTCQIVMGCISFIVGAYASAEAAKEDHYILNGLLGTPVWVGTFIIVTGIIGVNAAVKNTRGPIVACMVMNIICSLFAVILAINSSSSLYVTSYEACHSKIYQRYRSCRNNGALAADSVALIVGLIQFAISIACSAICCGVTCCRRCCLTEPSASNNPVILNSMHQQFVAQPLPQESGRSHEAQSCPIDSGYMCPTAIMSVDDPPTLPALRRPQLLPSVPHIDNEYSYVELPPQQLPKEASTNVQHSPTITSANVQQYFGVKDSGYVTDAELAYESITT